MPSAEDSQGRRTSIKLRVQYETANLLAASESLEEVAPRLLSMLCELLDWDVASLWEHDQAADNLKCVAVHVRPGCHEESFLEQTRNRRFTRGEGLPGRIWERGGPLFIPDIRQDQNFPRRHAVRELRTGAGFPISSRVLGVFEFFTRKERAGDRDEVVEALEAVALQLGQFLERSRAESTARHQSSWLEATMASITDAVISTDVSGQVRFLNKAAEQLTGWSLAEARGRQLEEVLRLEGDSPLRLLPRAGEERLVELNESPIVEGADEVLGRVVVVRDVTERHQAELRYRRLLDTTYEGVWIVDPDNRTHYANQRLGEMLGYSPDELLALPVRELFFPEDLAAMEERARHRREGKAEQLDVRLRHRSGQEVWALASASPIYDARGRYEGSFAMLTDITDRRRQEARLRRSEERTRSLVEAGTHATWIARPDGTIAQDSPSWRELTGQTPEELDGLGWLDAIHADDRPRVRESWLRAVRQGEPFSEEFRVWSVQNRFLYLYSRGVPVCSETGEVVEWVVANTDVTQRVEAQQQLQERVQHAAFHATVKDALASLDDLDALLEQCTLAMTGTLGLTSALIALQESGQLEVRSQSGPLPVELDWQQTELARMASTRRAHFANSLPRELDFPQPEWLEQEGMTAFAGQPIVLEEETLGVLAGFSRQVLSVNVLDALRELSDGLAAWFRRKRADELQARLYAGEQQARREAETLLRLSTAFARETSRQRLVQQVTDAGTELTGAAFGSFFYNVVNDKGESYMLYTISGAPREAFASFPMPRNTKVFSPTFHNQGSVVSDDITADPRYGHNEPYRGLPPGHLPVRSYLAVSVVSTSGEVIGGIFFGHPEPGRFNARHLEIAELLAAKSALAFERVPLET